MLGRVATGFSILFGFPLAMVGLRNSVVGMCESLADDATTALPPSVCSALLAVADDGNRFMLVVRARLCPCAALPAAAFWHRETLSPVSPRPLCYR